MRTVRLPLLRGALFIIALAAIAFITARGDTTPAQATSFEPQSTVSVSDPTPGANADIVIDFSIDKPDSFPNIRTNPAIQFLPRAWGIHTPTTERTDGSDTAPAEAGGQCYNSTDDDGDGVVNDGCPGAFAGTFNALTTLGLFGSLSCQYNLPVPFTLMDATTDTGYDEATGAYDPQKLASSLDLGGDYHPGGPGFSGEFVDDPNTTGAPGDLNLPLIPFNADEKFYPIGGADPIPNAQWRIYRDVDGSNNVSPGDILLNDRKYWDGTIIFPAGSVVTDSFEWRVYGDLGGRLFAMSAAMPGNVKRYDSNGNGVMDPGEDTIYRDNDRNNKVSYGDQRLYWFVQLDWGSIVQEFALPAGVTRYPDFLNQMFHPEVIGDPLARMFGAQDVLGNPVPLNLVTFRPGQLPGYPASLGYPTVVVVLNPVAPVDASIINLTSDLCAPLSLESTNLGISQDNPGTFANEGGYVRLSNPAPGQKGWQGEKGYDFTLIATSQPDADDDGIENMLDTCPLDPNIEDLDGRSGPGAHGGDVAMDPDNDALDGACDSASYPAPDIGRALVPFNPDEKWWGFGGFHSSGNTSLYRDNDGNSLVTPGDERLTPREDGWGASARLLQPGVVQDGDADYRDPATGTVRPDRGLHAFTPTEFKHTENVAANGRYDPVEDVYWDTTEYGGLGEVSVGDARLLFEGREIGWGFGEWVIYGGKSQRAPWFSIADEDQDNFGNRADNCSVVSNGVEVIGKTYVRLRNLSFTVLTYGNLIGPGNQTDTDMDDIGDACEGSEHGNVQCGNDLDDDRDGYVNDGCPTNPYRAAETWAQCANAADDDGDGKINDGCPAVRSGGSPESGEQCTNNADDDGDGKVNDGCPKVSGSAESAGQCLNDIDDDGDTLVNDGCPKTTGSPETGDQCLNNTDDDGDGLVNDGCPKTTGSPETGDQCTNAVDDDGDGLINDGCPKATGPSETGGQCANAVDDDGDGLVNQGCPTVGYSWQSEWQCADALDNDGDGYVNDGCPAKGQYSEWQCGDALDNDGDGVINDGCPVNGVYGERNWAGDCANAVDDDTDGVVNDGCPVNGVNAESGAQCTNAVDDDTDGVVNDGCPLNGAGVESGGQCANAVDDDFDVAVNDGCPADPILRAETACGDDVDNDGDGKVNDGCPAVNTPGVPEAQCNTNTNDDSSDDSFVNDGCPAVGEAETGGQCGNTADDDGDGYVNDGCPAAGSIAETDGCANSLDDDADGLVNDGCPSVDSGYAATMTPTGHLHVETLVSSVAIAKHGVKLEDLDGPGSVAAGGSATYKVSVENKSDSAEDVPVALQVVEGCGIVSGPSTVHVNGDASANAQFTVDFSGCAAGEYTVQADACHAGDPAPAGLFGEGACPDPGTADGLVDTNTLDDAPRSITVEVGTTP